MNWSRMRQLAATVTRTGAAGPGPSAPEPAAVAPPERFVVSLIGAGPAYRLPDLEQNLSTALASGPTALVVDMSSLREISSSTVAELLWTWRRCSARGVRVLLRDPSPRCVVALDRVGLLEVLSLEPDAAEDPSRHRGTGRA